MRPTSPLVRATRTLLARCRRSFAGSPDALGACWECTRALATVLVDEPPAPGPYLCDGCAAGDRRRLRQLATAPSLRRLQRLLAAR